MERQDSNSNISSYTEDSNKKGKKYMIKSSFFI